MALSKSQANSTQKTRKGDYGLSFKDYNTKKKQETELIRTKLADQRASASIEARERKDQLKKDQETVANNTSEDMKPTGVGKLNALINSQVTKVTSLVVPNLLLLVAETTKSQGPNLCPSPEVTQRTLLQLNNIVKSLNSTVEEINKVAQISTAASTGVNIIQTVSSTITTTIPIVSAAAKAIPVIPGAVVSVLDDLDYINNKLLYKNDGTPRLPVIVGSVNSISMSISLFSSGLRNAISLINSLSALLSKCLPEGQKQEIETLSDLTQQYADYGNDNYENYDNTSYKGFIIKMEEVPFTPTVNRRRAVGYTTNGVPLIQTELSFSTNNQTLTTELKLIIDRDNLKAY
jgi:hypothetical protein